MYMTVWHGGGACWPCAKAKAEEIPACHNISTKMTKVKINSAGIKKPIGRSPKVDFKTIIKLADALQHSANISDACRYAGISRDTYYRYMKNEPVFAEKMGQAIANQYTVVFSSLTTYKQNP